MRRQEAEYLIGALLDSARESLRQSKAGKCGGYQSGLDYGVAIGRWASAILIANRTGLTRLVPESIDALLATIERDAA